MKFFLDSAKLDEIDFAYNTFGIDGVTTNPRHVQASGKPFKVVLRDIGAWLKDHGLTGYEQFPVSVEINPHLSLAADMMREGKVYAALNPCFVIKLPCTEQGIAASRQLEREGIRTNVTLVFSPSQALPPATSCRSTRPTASRPRLSWPPCATPSRSSMPRAWVPTS
jgi:transaldolase